MCVLISESAKPFVLNYLNILCISYIRSRASQHLIIILTMF